MNKVFSLIMVIFVTACGVDQGSKIVVKRPQIDDENFVPIYHLPEDPNFSSNISTTKDLNPIQELSSQMVKTSKFTNDEHEVIYEQKENNLKLSYNYGILNTHISFVGTNKNDGDFNQGIVIPFDPHYKNFGKYRENSLEGVALSVTTAVADAALFYQKLKSNFSFKNFPMIEIIVEPMIINLHSYALDNASYIKDAIGRNYIVAFPNSALKAKEGILYVHNAPIFYHEYGHFVLHNEIKDWGEKPEMLKSLDENLKFHFDSEFRREMTNKMIFNYINKTKKYSNLTSEDKEKFSNVMDAELSFERAFNEGFADLFAYLVSDENQNYFSHFDLSRNLNNNLWEMGVGISGEKIVNTQFLKDSSCVFMLKIDLVGCSKEWVKSVQFASLAVTESHVAGSVYAYVINKVLSDTFGDDKVKSPLKKGIALIKWLQKINKFKESGYEEERLTLFTERKYFYNTYQKKIFDLLFQTLDEEIQQEEDSLEIDSITASAIRTKASATRDYYFSGLK